MVEKNQVEVLGKQYRDVMTMGWNTGLEKLMKPEENISGEVDFSFRGKTPTTQADVKEILFGDEVTTMVKSGNLAEPMALLYKWGYYLTMEGCSLNWTSKATMDYIELKGYNVELGNCRVILVFFKIEISKYSTTKMVSIRGNLGLSAWSKVTSLFIIVNQGIPTLVWAKDI